MIWVPGVVGQEITDDHIDATSRFVRPGEVLVQVPPASRTDLYARDAREQVAILKASTDATGRRLNVIEIQGPETPRSNPADFLDSHANCVVVNGAVIVAQFGDAVADASARATLAAAYPGRVVEQFNVDRLMAGGGGIHCVTAHEPA